MTQLRLGLALLGAGSAIAAFPVAAEAQQQGAFREDAGTALTRHLRTLSDQPRSVSALFGAGKAALELGDAQAALTFFARAEEVAPRDGRVKAGMGSAFLAMEQPTTAMRFFTEAASLGAPEAEYAGDRGLVHDLAGDPRRAQADYVLALSRQENDEVRRRLALSYAISGERDRALGTLDAQLRRQDRAAWRTRAFILALSGDARGATTAAEATMPQQAAQMQPFFAKLPALSPAQRAMAVHFGHFPGDGQPARPAGTQYASVTPAPSNSAAATQAGRPDPAQAALGTRRRPARSEPAKPAPASSEPTRRAETQQPKQERPSRAARAASRREPKPLQVRAVPIETAATPVPAPAQAPAEAGGLGQVSQIVEAQRDEAPPVPAPQAPSVATTEPAATAAQTETRTPVPPPAEQQPAQQAPAETASIQATDLPPSTVSTPEPPRQEPSEGPAEPAASTFANIAAAIASLPEEKPPAERIQLAEAKTTPPAPAAPKETKPKPVEAPKPAPAKKADADKPVAATKKEPAAKKEPAKKEAAAKKEEAPKEPSRHWVQIAGGANEAAMSTEFKRLRGKAPKLLGTRTAWMTPLRATNRLLVGPFKSSAEAQEFVNELAKLDLAAFSWTSPAGQEIVKLTVK